MSDRRADISSRSGKQLQHTMENSTDSMSDLDYKSLVNQCLEMCSALKDKGCKFSLSLRLGSSFNFSLSSEGCSPPEATQKPRRSPSYLRRQTLRRAAFLQRKKKPPLAEETASTGNDNNVCRQEGSDLLDKKVASSGQTAQPPPPPPPLPPPPAVPTRRLVTVTKDRASRSSFCQLDGEAPLPEEERAAMEAIKIRIRQRAGEGYAKQGSNCEDCQQIIVDKRLRYYPASCESCSGWTPDWETYVKLAIQQNHNY